MSEYVRTSCIMVLVQQLPQFAHGLLHSQQPLLQRLIYVSLPARTASIAVLNATSFREKTLA